MRHGRLRRRLGVFMWSAFRSVVQQLVVKQILPDGELNIKRA